MNRRFVVAVSIVTAVLIAPPAVADWIPGDPFKMHNPQLPDPIGWDVFNTYNDLVQPPVVVFLADDWRCTETGEINEIHIWGSWRRDLPTMVSMIHVQIHADDRSGPFSKPAADPLWVFDFSPGQFIERLYPRRVTRVGTTRTPASSFVTITETSGSTACAISRISPRPSSKPRARSTGWW